MPVFKVGKAVINDLIKATQDNSIQCWWCADADVEVADADVEVADADAEDAADADDDAADVSASTHVGAHPRPLEVLMSFLDLVEGCFVRQTRNSARKQTSENVNTTARLIARFGNGGRFNTAAATGVPQTKPEAGLEWKILWISRNTLQSCHYGCDTI